MSIGVSLIYTHNTISLVIGTSKRAQEGGPDFGLGHPTHQPLSGIGTTSSLASSGVLSREALSLPTHENERRRASELILNLIP